MVLFLTGCQALYLFPSEVSDPDVLFQDDYSRSTGGWEVDDTNSYIRGYDRDGYRVFVKEGNLITWSVLDLVFQDSWISVKATKLGGPDKNGFGIICRFSDDANFYFGLVASDGYYGIGKRKDGIQTLIAAPNLDYSQAIQQGENLVNEIQMGCIQNTLTLIVNGSILAEVQAIDFPEGRAGVFAGTFEQAGADILFDDFVIRSP